MRWVVLFAAALAAAFPAPALSQQWLDSGEVATVRLDEAGEARVRVRLEHDSVVMLPVFAGPETVTDISIALESVSESTPVHSLTLPAGRHNLVLSGGPMGQGETVIQVRTSFIAPNDAFEPNDTPETARRVDLPFNQVVRLASGDWDWFEIDPGGSTVLGIQLLGSTGSYTGPQIRVVDPAGVALYASPATIGGWNGMRYVEVERGPVFVGVTDSSPWAGHQPQGFKTLEIMRIDPIGDFSGRLITLSLETDDPSLFQLDLVGRALGVEVRAADEAGRVAAELAEVVRGEGFDPRGPGWVIWMILVLALGIAAAGVIVIIRLRARLSD